MTELQKQVHRAQRRIVLQTFLSSVIWTLVICLAIAALAVAATKVRFVDVEPRTWSVAWLTGSVGVAFVSAAIWTWWKRSSLADAAIEIDRRYGLKERVSSSFCLTAAEADTEIGQALVADAARRVQRIDVREKFGIQASRWAFLPLVTGVLAVALVFLPDAKPQDSSKQAQAKTVEVNRVKKTTTALKKKLAKQRELLKEKNLREASKLAQKLEKGLDKLAKSDADKKKTMIEMNNLAQELRQQRESLKGSETLKKRLNQMKEMKVKEGPADELARAMQNGDFKKALDQIKQLQQQLKDAKLTPQQQRQLAQQMQQMQKKLEEMVKQHEQAKKDLEEQIAQAKQQGNDAAAKKLQKKLDQLKAQDEAMQRLQQMAQKMDQVAKNMQQGNPQEAMQQLAQMAEDLENMQQEMAELEALEAMMDQLAAAKDSMNCDQCDGGG